MPLLLKRYTQSSFSGFHMFRYNSFISFLLILIQAQTGFAQLNQTARQKPKFMIMFSGIISLYHNDPRITANTSPLPGYSLSVRSEFPIAKDLKLVTGLEIISQGLTFDSYYFAPGSSVLFDKNYIYNHNIRCNEIAIPLLIRMNLTPREEAAFHTFYVSLGWELKYNLSARSTIINSNDGSLLYDGPVSLSYENHFLNQDIGNYIVASLGYNRNLFPSKKSVFFDITYRYGLSRNLYTGNGNSNHLFFRNTNLNIGIGIRL